MGVDAMNGNGVITGDAGRIGFLIKGDYKSTETYDFLDVVYYGNSSYVAKKETIGNIPQENDEYWQILAKGGISGTAGVTGVKGNAEFIYRTGEVNLTAANIGAVEAEAGKGLSTNDLTDDLLEKIENAGTGSVTGVKGELESEYRTGDVDITKEDLGIYTMSTEYIGLGKPDGISITVDEDGTMHANSDGDYASKDIYGDTNVSLGRVANSTVGDKSFVFGSDGQATNIRSTSFGNQTVSSGINAFTCGSKNAASGENSFAGGTHTDANGDHSDSEGYYTTANGDCSHSEGNVTVANATASHSEGSYTSATNYSSHVCGKYNAAMTTGGELSNTTGHVFVVGNGISSASLSNAFSIMYNGIVKAKSTITASTTADYAEFFEWLDGNSNDEDRVGKFVTLDGDKIRIAQQDDNYILGIVSGEPFVLGNGDCDTWNGMFLKDDFNRTLYEPAPKVEINEETGGEEEVLDENGVLVYAGTRPVLNPSYDPTQTYVSRFERQEWDAVGMLGALSVYDDGSCKVNGFCTCGNDGVATASEHGYRVIERIKDNIVKVIFR